MIGLVGALYKWPLVLLIAVLAGVIGGLLSNWLANMALLLDAEIDADLTRARHLQVGLPAEVQVPLPPWSDRGLKKSQRQQEKFLAEGREIREHADRVATACTKTLE